jgi:hypothetical protein
MGKRDEDARNVRGEPYQEGHDEDDRSSISDEISHWMILLESMERRQVPKGTAMVLIGPHSTPIPAVLSGRTSLNLLSLREEQGPGLLGYAGCLLRTI